MKSLMLYLRTLLQDMEEWCNASTTRDWKTISRRVEHEGLSFLTITLPSFCKDFEQALALEMVAPSHFVSFSRDGGLPRFLGGFLERVFDRATGVLLDDPDVACILAIRQISLSFSKINLPCSAARTKRAFDQYIECERQLEGHLQTIHPSLWDGYSRLAGLLWSDVAHSVLRSVQGGNFRPGHGPGSTADRKFGNSKWMINEWPERLEVEFDSVSNLAPNSRWVSHLDEVKLLEPGHEQPVKVVGVPKTLKGPRIIAMEPSYMMFVQQGLYRLFFEAIHGDELLCSLIGWRSSEPNNSLALEGSRKGSLATLDLSEASDRVAIPHVLYLFGPRHPVTKMVMAARSRKAEVPGHGVQHLFKYASMGSALTFPLEAMVFLTIVLLGIERELSAQLTLRDIRSLKGQVRVYGDDIIVPTDYAVAVMSTLEAFGFKVNSNKSFWTGRFRESCGKEYYAGEDVSIVRVRHRFPSHRQDARELEATVALRNQLYLAGCWKTVRLLDSWLERLIPFPIVEPTSRVLGRTSFLGLEEARKMDKDLHVPLVRGAVVVSPSPASPLDGVHALHKVFLTASELPNPDQKHLERAGRPRSSYTKVGWFPPF